MQISIVRETSVKVSLMPVSDSAVSLPPLLLSSSSSLPAADPAEAKAVPQTQSEPGQQPWAGVRGRKRKKTNPEYFPLLSSLSPPREEMISPPRAEPGTWSPPRLRCLGAHSGQTRVRWWRSIFFHKIIDGAGRGKECQPEEEETGDDYFPPLGASEAFAQVHKRTLPPLRHHPPRVLLSPRFWSMCCYCVKRLTAAGQ